VAQAGDLGRDGTGGMIVLIDNYDSFTYNLVQRIGELDPTRTLRVYRNDQVTLEEIEADQPDHLIISPGPCTPREGGISCDVVKHFAGQVPLLGVCLGHQAIGYAFGGEIVRAPRMMHGKTSMIHHDNLGVFQDLPIPFEATRYHSLVIKPDTLPPDFIVTAYAEDEPEQIMGIRHRELPIEGVQFHPESFLTGVGHRLLANFLGIETAALAALEGKP
jgi:anthranilate synthase/aminodeoxychorismate synthase-like glutamine amidotransferase